MDQDFKIKLADRFEAFELADFLQVPIEEFLDACEEFGWINEDNMEDLDEFLLLAR